METQGYTPPEEFVGVHGTVVMVKHDLRTGRKHRYITHNIVTNDGDTHYAEKGGNQGNRNSTDGFTFSGDGSLSSGVMILGTAGITPAKTAIFGHMTTAVADSRKEFDNGYPTTSDSDGDNPTTGADVLSFRTSYTTSEANASGIDRVMITESGTTTMSGTVLMYATFATSVNKTSADTLKVFVNHTFNGV
jgi:hypothetical protein